MGAFISLCGVWYKEELNMSKTTKSSNAALERRLKIYEKYGLKPIVVHKTGAGVVFSSRPTRKGEK